MTLRADLTAQRGSFRLEAALTAPAGRLLAVLGPNGAGKTTLLRLLAGLERVETGFIELDGVVLDAPGRRFVPPEERRAGVVFQDGLLFPHLSALDNVAFGVLGERSNARAVARDWMERFGLGHRAGARPHELSGGERQRVALARALAPQPPMLLLDEPFAALDATTRAEIRQELRQHLLGYAGVALLVTHDVSDAALADEVVVLESGRVSARGQLAELAERPRSSYLADLFTMNLWPASSDGTTVRSRGFDIAIRAPAGPVWVAVSPRHVEIAADTPTAAPAGGLRGVVTSVEHVGGVARVTASGALRVIAESAPAAAPGVGEEVWTSFDPRRAAVYPAAEA